MADQLRVMISSTARDLPEHRKEAMDACLRQGMFPIMMEHLPASDDEAIPASLKLVDEADVYLLILANRYGCVPDVNNPQKLSVTEHEYNRAVEMKIPILTFAMHEDHPVRAADVEKGEGAIKLEAFKARALVKVTSFFKSPADLRAHVIHSLSDRRQRDLTSFHYVSEIPKPPEPFIAHPYTLLQTHTLIGRQKELNLLTDWIIGKELEFDGLKAPADSARIMSVVAIGGMGKSALTWKWFNDVAPREMKNLGGRMWWSFYESDATFENFVIRALAYVSRRSIQKIAQIPAPEREMQLLSALDRKPFLFVLDGLERILGAYARMDAARLDDSEVGKEKNLRKNADPRVGRLLQKLAQVKQSRILVSSRLYPTELETSGSDPIPGSFRIKIEGLTDEDAVELWRAFGVSGSRDDVLPVFHTFAKHPLLIQALAGEVKRYRKAPGDFEKWRNANPKFDPIKCTGTKEAMAHVLEFALRALDEKRLKVLQLIAAFRMPARYDSLASLLIATGWLSILSSRTKPCADEQELDRILDELENRGLVGWDRRANRYDLHPVVRSIVWGNLDANGRRVIYARLRAHLKAAAKIERSNASGLEGLTTLIELYNILIGLERYDEAGKLFHGQLFETMHYQFGAYRQNIELLEMLFPDGVGGKPRLRSLIRQAVTLDSLALAFQYSGQPRRTISPFRDYVMISNKLKDDVNLIIALCNLSDCLCQTGSLHQAESAVRRALAISRKQNRFDESVSHDWLGVILATRGAVESVVSLKRCLQIFLSMSESQFEGVVNCHLAQRALWFGDSPTALSFANHAWELAQDRSYERDVICAARQQGVAERELNKLLSASERLQFALTHARTVNYVVEELPALVALAELRRIEGERKVAREYLDDVWESAARGPYPLFHADAFNVLAQIERDEGNNAAAVEAATNAYRLAWCDGPPFAYHWGLEKAKQHLKELGAPEPEMPAFDESKFGPMPEVEINPRDEFYVDEKSIS